MKIGVLCTCFDEALMLPYFLSHYTKEGWDSIHVMLDRETTDNSAEICSKFSNTMVKECGMKAGLQEEEKVAILKKEFDVMCAEDFDWLAVLDTDEFIVPPAGTVGGLAKEFLERQKECDCVVSKMFPVYRHRTDRDLDPSYTPLRQRLHGGSPRWNEIKPNVLKADPKFALTIGMHKLGQEMLISPVAFTGVHWADADPAISVPRRLRQKARFSKENLEKGWGIQHHNCTFYSIMQEAAEHLDDPLIVDLARIAL